MTIVVECIQVAGRYRTNKVRLVLSEDEAWEHVDQCPHGHALRVRS